MKVTVLGSGTIIPDPGRSPAGYLVKEDGAVFLVDCGPGTIRRLINVGVDPADIDAVLLTHFHTDHTCDVPALLFALRNPRYEGRKPLGLYGATGLSEWLGHLTAAWPWIAPGGYTLDVHELEPGKFSVAHFDVTAFEVEHTDQSLGYRIRGHLPSEVAFTGDAVYDDKLIALAQDVDLFICDSAFPTAAPGPGHMTATEAGRIAERANVGTLCLTHFYPECEGHDMVAEARAEFGGGVVMAVDNLEFEL